MLSRRQFIQSTVVAVTGMQLIPMGWAKEGKLPVALQLYSIRKDCAADFDAALAAVAKAGFQGVEFAGYHTYQNRPKELRKRLDDLGLKVAATHIGTNTLRGEELKKTIDFHQQIGCKFLIVPSDRDITDAEKSKALAETFNQVAETLKPLGMACGYHNHAWEFKPSNEAGKTWWELFADRTGKEVILQQDCGWTAAAGFDPAEMMKRYPGRMKSTHFKPTVVGDDKTKKAFLGEDSVDWVKVLAACKSHGGTEWITLEQEAYPDGKTPMEASIISFKALQKLNG